MEDTFTYSYGDGDLTVSYQKTGAGKPLIILHGWGSSGRVMMPLAHQLKHLRTCYVLDLPGFGNSSLPDRAWSVDDYTDLVQQFMQDTFEGQVDLLVHSYGGRITLKLCARSSGKERVDKVLITGGAGMKPKRTLSFYIKKYTAKMLKAPLLLMSGTARDHALAWLRQTTVWQSLGSKEYGQLQGVMRETFVKAVSEFLEPCLPQIPHEVLLLWGRNDEATPLYQGERMEKGIKNAALVVIEDAGHYAFLDRPKHFASIAKAFFKA